MISNRHDHGKYTCDMADAFLICMSRFQPAFRGPVAQQRFAGQPGQGSPTATLDQTQRELLDITMGRPSPCIVL